MSVMADKALNAKRESRSVEFKRSFDPAKAGEWCELIKDIVAIANSGGGAIVIGYDNNGQPSGHNVTQVQNIDSAVLLDKIKKYTGFSFTDIDIHEAEKNGVPVVIFEIAGVPSPIVFERVGTYEAEPGKQKTAFSKGTIYYRHGAKSEPATSEDLQRTLDSRLQAIRSEWMKNVRKVIAAPTGSAVSIFSGEVRESKVANAMPIRLVDDPSAPGYRLIDHDTTYPHRQKELIDVVNAMLPDGISVNTHDVLALRRTHSIDSDMRYCHTPRFGSPQYSDAFAKWIVDGHKKDKNFFEAARAAYYKKMHAV